MTLADGTLKIYTLTDTAEAGEMPKERLVPKYSSASFYADRVVGFHRQYAAMGVDQRIDRLVRIWFIPVEIGEYVILDETEQYRVDNVQMVRDEDGLKTMDLTLSRLEANYEVLTE